jgi:hypothetical protein
VGFVPVGVHPRTLEIVPVTVPRRDDAIPITPPAGSYADEYCLISYTRKLIHNAYPTSNTADPRRQTMSRKRAFRVGMVGVVCGTFIIKPPPLP